MAATPAAPAPTTAVTLAPVTTNARQLTEGIRKVDDVNPQLWWLVARATGVVAWGLLTASVIWGLLVGPSLTRGRPTPAWLTDLHRFLGGAAVVFTALHLGGLVADTYTHFGVTDLLVPLASAWKPGPVALGVVALYLLLAVELSPVDAPDAAALVEGDPPIELRALLDRDAALRHRRHRRRQPPACSDRRRRSRDSRVPHARANPEPTRHSATTSSAWCSAPRVRLLRQR